MSKTRETLKTFERIRKKEDFDSLREKGKSISSIHYAIVFTINDLPYSRLAVITGKRIGNAVVRNYQRRLCKEFFRRNKVYLPAGYDYLIIVRKPSAGFKESWEELSSLFGSVKENIEREKNN